jgi:transcriptional regulator with XRE-family HTH domain
MQIAARIQKVRLEHSRSLEDLAAKVGLSTSLLASFEQGEDVPSLETFDSLAKAMGVPVKDLFYGNLDSNLTPYLTPRLTLQQFIDEYYRPAPDPDDPQNNRVTAE